jgi:hypothetical protein
MSDTNDIEKIVSNPNLFALVNARIAADGKPASLKAPTGLFFRRNVIAFTGIAVIVFAAIAAATLIRTEKAPSADNEAQIPDAVPDVARLEVFPPPFVGKLSAGRASKIDFRVGNAVANKADGRSESRNRRPANVEFYAVGYTDDPPESSGGGRIIRVELHRSSLFALGVNLPLENDEETISADLLVGSDGVTRAVRIVK